MQTAGGLRLSLRLIGPDDADALTDVAVRSKAYWGYDDRFMELAHAELKWVARDLVRDQIRGELVHNDDRLAGFYLLDWGDSLEPELDAMYIDPAYIRQGVGRLLFDRVVSQARAGGAGSVLIQSDPNAEGFYKAMGAKSVGSSPSQSIPGRLLPLLRLAI